MKPVRFIPHTLMMCMLPGASAPVLAQTLTPLVNQLPGGIEHTLLLTDGTGGAPSPPLVVA